jgi:hypothetical protein
MKMMMNIPRPKIKKTRYWIDNEYIERGYMRTFVGSVTLVYDVLARHANARTQTCFPSIKTISKEAGLGSRRIVIEAIRTLERYAIIAVVRRPHRANEYLLRDCRTWIPLEGFTKDTTPVQKENQYGSETATLSHKSESEKEIMDGILEKLNPMIRSHLLSDFEIRRTILALKKIEQEGVDLGTLNIGQLCYYLEKKGVLPIKRHSWINYDHGFKKP